MEYWRTGETDCELSCGWVRSAIGVVPRSKATHLKAVKREDDRLKFKVNACLEPVLSGDGDPFVIGMEGICGLEVGRCREGRVCGLPDDGEEVEVGKGCKDEGGDDGLYGGEGGTPGDGSRNGTHYSMVWRGQ